jgi:branched-chain amino acid transport system substrate-binding protein
MKKILIPVLLAAVLLGSYFFFLKEKDRKIIKIGVIFPHETEAGQLLWNGVKMAAEEINDKGGILKRKIVLFPVDDRNKTDIAVRNLRNFLQQEKPDLLIGGMSSGVVLELMEVMADHKILWLGTGGADTAVIDKIRNDYQRYRFYFRVETADSSKQAEFFTQFVKEVYGRRFGFKNYAVLAINLKYSRTSMARVKTLLKKQGFRLKYEEYFPPNTLDFSSYFRNAEKSGADFILSYTLGAEGIRFLEQYYDMKVSIPEFGSHILSEKKNWMEETGGKGVWDTNFQMSGGDFSFTPKTKIFYSGFKKKYGKAPNFLSYPAYDALYILQKAAQQVKALDTDTLIRTIETMEYEGNVRYRFTRNHDLTYGKKDGKRYLFPIYFQWKKNGKRVVVWPQDVAEAPYELPDWIQKKQ